MGEIKNLSKDTDIIDRPSLKDVLIKRRRAINGYDMVAVSYEDIPRLITLLYGFLSQGEGEPVEAGGDWPTNAHPPGLQ